MLPDLNPTIELVSDSTGANTVTVLRTLHSVVFRDLSGGRGWQHVQYGYSDYYNLLCNIINTFNTHHDILYPFLQESSWNLSPRYRDRFDDLRRRLEKEKEKEKGRNVSSEALIDARLRYRDTDTTSNNLKVAMDRHINRCVELHAAAAAAAVAAAAKAARVPPHPSSPPSGSS
ncbi:hypothetical protein TRAPUB_4702 [Trametes pubescens]|uniref:Uncharacterized protein n=1 Tax=Trametes pubescens TaxID=154538 RepID=A0A1M2VAN5_TRAPU|nr:hypothetical protein TRAPUB_4702 [Trametes pubescens]